MMKSHKPVNSKDIRYKIYNPPGVVYFWGHGYMAKLKETDDYDELSHKQQQMVDLRARYPNLPKSDIPKYIDGIADKSTYQYQVFKQHGHIVESRRQHFKETGEYDESVTELEVEEAEKDDLDRFAEQAEEPGRSRNSGKEKTERGKVSVIGQLDARTREPQGIKDRPVKERMFACSCGAWFEKYAKLQEHLDTCDGEIEQVPTEEISLGIETIIEILGAPELSKKAKGEIISQLRDEPETTQ